MVRIFSANPHLGLDETGNSYADFKDWQAQTQSLEYVAAYASGGAFLTGDGESERVGATGVTGDFFAVLGTPPLVGRTLTGKDEGAGAVVISYALWQRRYGGRSDLVGHTLTFNSNTASIIGIMPPAFGYPQGTDLWTIGVQTDSPRSSRGLGVIARLKPGANLPQAQAEMGTIGSRLSDAYPQTNRGWQVRAVSLRELRARSTSAILLISFAGAALLLLIACANIGTLQLVRVADRRQEIAMRFVLGASRGRIVRLLLIEGLLLSLSGTAIGLVLAFWSVRMLLGSGILRFSGVSGITIDLRILVFTSVVSIAATVLFTLLPARYSLAVGRSSVVGEAGRTTTPGASVHQSHFLLVAGELSLVLVLLTTTSLLTTSFNNILHVNLGFDPKGVLTGRVAYFDHAKRLGFFTSVIDRVRTLPGVTDAAGSYSLPLDNGGAYWRRAIIVPQDRPRTSELEVGASYHIVSPSYFRLLRIPVSEGRAFVETDAPDALPVAIINQTLARSMWPNTYAVGRSVLCCEENRPRQIVGVVGDLKSQSPETPPEPEIYMPLAQDTQVSMRILVRASGDPRWLVPEVRAAIATVDPNWPLYDVRTMEQIYDSVLAPRRSQLILLGAFAGIALVLSVLGVHGTFTYAGASRSREIAIRVALGASQTNILKLVLRRTILILALGLSVGIGLTVFAELIIRGSLYGVSPFDPSSYIEVTALLASTAFACSLVPAFRASRADPLPVLREQ